jgi:Patatin-like phospholipase
VIGEQYWLLDTRQDCCTDCFPLSMEEAEAVVGGIIWSNAVRDWAIERKYVVDIDRQIVPLVISDPRSVVDLSSRMVRGIQMALEVEIALQGGGARLYALLAAMKAVEDLETNGEIKVTKIDGTSAGAIAATIYAARVPMKNALNELDTLDFDKVLKQVEKKRRLKECSCSII